LQDDYALSSYQRATNAWKDNLPAAEIAPVEVSNRGQRKVVSQDEEHLKLKMESLPQLKGAFGGAGSVTAGNSSSISDGASAVVLTTFKRAKQANVQLCFVFSLGQMLRQYVNNLICDYYILYIHIVI